MIGHVALLAAAHAAYPDAGDAVIDGPGSAPYEVRCDVGGVPRACGVGATSDEARANLAAVLWDTAARAACVRVALRLRGDSGRPEWAVLAHPGRLPLTLLHDHTALLFWASLGAPVDAAMSALTGLITAVRACRYDAAAVWLGHVDGCLAAVTQ